ncbi:MAG: asparaginase domain-containing protein [Porticoccaceae bacterium]|nr:asparaginase domain-containing protein [Porticoccaceae bacterium]MDG1473967.1 asparaginase domain-containing protein [Porticoccaceae bacterium]
MDSLVIFTTGGTIDKVYFDDASEFQVGHPIIENLLHKMNVGFTFRVDQLMRVDSLNMTAKDREYIRQKVFGTNSPHILITHGTDGMVETASYLQGMEGKTIVLTGALQPAAFSENDAVFNIGCAVGGIQTLREGVYIAMNGQIFDVDKVQKNRKENRFESI